MKRWMDEEENVTTTTQQQPPRIAPGGDLFPRPQHQVLAPAPVDEPMADNIHPSDGIQSYSSPPTDQVPPFGQGSLGQYPSVHSTHLRGFQQSSPHPRSLTHPNSAHSQTQAQGRGQQFQCLNTDYTLSDLDQEKRRLANNIQVYNDFVSTMEELESRSIYAAGIVSYVSNLFKEHPYLLKDLNAFLPSSCKIKFPPNDLIGVSTPTQAVQLMGHATIQPLFDNLHHAQFSPTQPPALPSKPLPSSPHPFEQPPSLPGFPTRYPVPSNTSHISRTTQHPSQPQLYDAQPIEVNDVINDINKIKLEGEDLVECKTSAANTAGSLK